MIDFTETRFVDERYYRSLSENRVARKGDVLITVTASYGIALPVDTDLEFCFQRHIAVLKPRGIDRDYLVYALQSTPCQKYFDSVATGTAQKTVGLAPLRLTPIPLPPLAEQKAIVRRLEELLALENEIAADNAALDDLISAAKRKVLQLAISGQLNAGTTSAGWKRVRLGNVCEVARGGSPRPIKDYLTDSPNGLNWIKIGDADGTKYITSVKEKIIPEGLHKTRQVHAGDLLLTNSMSFGHPYVLKVDGCIHDGWLVLHPSDKLDKEFLYWILVAPQTMEQFRMAASGGVVSNLNSDKVSATSIPLPSLAEQKAIVAKVDELFSVLDAMKGNQR